MGNVISISSARPNMYTKSQLAIVDIIRDEVLASLRAGQTMYAIASKAGVSPQTVSKLVYKQTRFPRLSTITGLLVSFGYDLVAIRTN